MEHGEDDTNCIDYLKLFITFYPDVIPLVFIQIIQNLFKDSTSFLKLLSIGWIGHVIPSQPMGFKPSPLFQVRCLNMASAIFGSMEEDKLHSLLGKESFGKMISFSCAIMWELEDV